ncbi:MAG TPA: DUF5309 family protein [Candidatus Binatus sp.]|nr:DUF5309 family protein [Candidatus Binatus sp.]
MAGTIVSTPPGVGVSTEDVLSDERVIDMDDKIRVLKPDDTQFTTMTDRVGARQAIREKVNWLEEEDFPRIVSAAAGQTASSGALTLTAGQGKVVGPNDMLRNMRSGEMSRVLTVTTDALTVANGVGNIAAAAVNSGDVFLVVADAQPQGSDLPNPRYLQRVLGYNYTQITRTVWTFTGTQTAIELYGGREPAKEAKRKAREHKKKWEAILFFGARSFAANSGAAPGNGEPQGTCGGMLEYISTFKRDAAGPLTPDFFDLFLLDIMQYGSEDKVLFASPLVAYGMAKWNRTGMGSQFIAPADGTVHGVHVDAFISGAYGYRIPVVVKKEWGEFPSNVSTPAVPKGFGSYAFLIDMNYVEQRPLRDRDTKLLTEQQPKGRDTYSAEYMREASFECAHERAHGIIFGVTQ